MVEKITPKLSAQIVPEDRLPTSAEISQLAMDTFAKFGGQKLIARYGRRGVPSNAPKTRAK